jgi:hypothetical protein
LRLKNETNQFFLPFICCRLGKSIIGKEKAREKERKVKKKYKKNPRKKIRKVKE